MWVRWFRLLWPDQKKYFIDLNYTQARYTSCQPTAYKYSLQMKPRNYTKIVLLHMTYKYWYCNRRLSFLPITNIRTYAASTVWVSKTASKSTVCLQYDYVYCLNDDYFCIYLYVFKFMVKAVASFFFVSVWCNVACVWAIHLYTCIAETAKTSIIYFRSLWCWCLVLRSLENFIIFYFQLTHCLQGHLDCTTVRI